MGQWDGPVCSSRLLGRTGSRPSQITRIVECEVADILLDSLAASASALIVLLDKRDVVDARDGLSSSRTGTGSRETWTSDRVRTDERGTGGRHVSSERLARLDVCVLVRDERSVNGMYVGAEAVLVLPVGGQAAYVSLKDSRSSLCIGTDNMDLMSGSRDPRGKAESVADPGHGLVGEHGREHRLWA